MDRRLLVDGDQDARLGDREFGHAAERKAHLGQGLVIAPRIGDDGDLIAPTRRALLPGGPHGLDALAGCVVHGGAHVLVGLALESEARQVQQGLLGDLHDSPALLARGLRELLVDRVERGGQARGGREGRELRDRLGGLARLVRQVCDRQCDASRPAIGDPGLAGRRHPHLVAVPGLHPPEGARAVGTQERREALERRGQRDTRPSEQCFQDDGEGADPGDEGNPQDGCLRKERHRDQGRLEDRGRRRGEQREGVIVEDLQGGRIVGDGQVVAGVEGLEGDERVAREKSEDEDGARAADHEDQPAPQQGRGRGGLRVNREGTTHPPRDDAQGGVEDNRNEKERGCGDELGPGHPVLVGALGESDTRRRDRRQTEDQLEDQSAEVGGAPALA